MKLEVKVFSVLCALEVFRINGIEADSDDFGELYDASPQTAEEYGCGNKVFESRMPTSDILKKYNIDVDEYSKICDKLEGLLSFGRCGWCI